MRDWTPADWAALILTAALAAMMVATIWINEKRPEFIKEVVLAIVAILSMWFFSKRA